MKVAVTSQGSDLASMVDPRFGRAKYFVVVDTETGEFASHDNSQNFNAAQGAGTQAGQTIVGLGAEALISGNIGPRAFTTLAAGNISVYTGATGSVKDAIEQYKLGQLTCADQANVEGHWT
ncbi:MAG: NifB/NifX family molybdenum-iron cluster-binding protein [Phycisphaerales bacterium]|nr:NifB/NifX family molybdenum-iron cluster-binding protein [Phycisphaerales bacterium]